MLLAFLKRHRETLFITILGLMIFSALNLMMVNVNPTRFTNPHYGQYTAFKDLYVSGFDFYTYFMVSYWQPRFELYRHPFLSFMVWPMSEVNKGLKELLGINCAIYVVAVVWTIISTLSWLFIYKIIRKIIGLSWHSSLLYCLLLFSFSHVMMATFVPDHMILSMCVLLFSIYVIGKAAKENKALSIWKSVLLYFIGTAITTTNGIKIWLMDMSGLWPSLEVHKLKSLFKRSLVYIIPTAILVVGVVWQYGHTQLNYKKGQDRMIAIKMKTDTTFARQFKETKAKEKIAYRAQKKNQVGSSAVFKWTDMSIEPLPLLYENIYGEGLLLHRDYLLGDANVPAHYRPIFVKYDNALFYVVNGITVLLCVCGVYLGRRQRLLWIVLPPFLLDMLLHVGLRFAASDAYIMTAHWAFFLPIGIALLDSALKKSIVVRRLLRCTVLFISVFLWYYNLSLISYHLSQF